MSSVKFAEAKLKPDLSNYMDWSEHMETYLKRQKVWNITKEDPKSTTIDDDDNIDAYFHIEANCEAATRRTYLRACEGSAWKAWRDLSKAYLSRAAVDKPYIRKQLRALRLPDHVDMRSFVQKHRDLIKTYNDIVSAEVQNTDTDAKSMGMAGKDKMAMSEAVDLVIENLGKGWEDFITHLQQTAFLMDKELSMDTLERALIIEEAKRKMSETATNGKSEKKALVGREGKNDGTKKFLGKCYYC